MLFRRLYQADAVVYRSSGGKPAYYIQWEHGEKHRDLKRIARFCLDEIVEGRAVATGDEELGQIFIPQGYKFRPDFEGVALLHVGITEGQKEPVIQWVTDIIVKRNGILG